MGRPARRLVPCLTGQPGTKIGPRDVPWADPWARSLFRPGTTARRAQSCRALSCRAVSGRAARPLIHTSRSAWKLFPSSRETSFRVILLVQNTCFRSGIKTNKPCSPPNQYVTTSSGLYSQRSNSKLDKILETTHKLVPKMNSNISVIHLISWSAARILNTINRCLQLCGKRIFGATEHHKNASLLHG